MKRISLRPLTTLCLGMVLFIAAFTQKNNTIALTNRMAASPAFVGARWQMNEFKLKPAVDFDGDGKTDADLLQFMPECDRDNSITFGAEGAITTDEGAVQCHKGPRSLGKPVAWSYDANNGTIHITTNDQAKSVSIWKVLEASANVLKIETTVTQNGKAMNAVLSWKAL